MKKFLLSLFALLSIVFSAQADNFEVGGIWYKVSWESDDPSTPGEVYVTKNESDDYTGDIVIPAQVTYTKTYNVRYIESGAFKSCDGLTSITIPNSVTNIGYEAFKDCI